ncbi:hypothetical protein BD626DRAFT_478241, partial [Schizophyllum amplum]
TGVGRGWSGSAHVVGDAGSEAPLRAGVAVTAAPQTFVRARRLVKRGPRLSVTYGARSALALGKTQLVSRQSHIP